MFTDEEMDAAITLAYESGGRKAWWVGLCVGFCSGFVAATFLYVYVLGL